MNHAKMPVKEQIIRLSGAEALIRYADAAVDIKCGDSNKLSRAREDLDAAREAVTAVLDSLIGAYGTFLGVNLVRNIGVSGAAQYRLLAKWERPADDDSEAR